MSLFGKKVLNNEELQNEIELQKSQIKRELAYFRREQMLSIDEEIQKYKLKTRKSNFVFVPLKTFIIFEIK